MLVGKEIFKLNTKQLGIIDFTETQTEHQKYVLEMLSFILLVLVLIVMTNSQYPIYMELYPFTSDRKEPAILFYILVSSKDFESQSICYS